MSQKIYKHLTREDLIEALIGKDIEMLYDEPRSIYDGLKYGLTGYINHSNKDLISNYITNCEDELTYYQPEYNEKIWNQKRFRSFMVYLKKEYAQRDFPTLNILVYKDDDIEDPTFVDLEKQI